MTGAYLFVATLEVLFFAAGISALVLKSRPTLEED